MGVWSRWRWRCPISSSCPLARRSASTHSGCCCTTTPARGSKRARRDRARSTPMAEIPDPPGTTVWGLDPNVAAALAYAIGWVSGAVLLIFEPNKFVRFHALQSTIVFGALSLAWMVALSVPILGWIVAIFIIPPVSAVLWLLLMYKAYQGERYKVAVA